MKSRLAIITYIFVATAIFVFAGSKVYRYLFVSGQPITSDAETLDMLGWGADELDLKSLYTGAGTTVAEIGYRNVGGVAGCQGTDAEAIGRRARTFSKAETGLEGCTISVRDVRRAVAESDDACLSAVETQVAQWQADWDATSDSEPPYEFLDVYLDDNSGVDGIVDIYDKVTTIERLAGWPVGDPVNGYPLSPTIWNGDDNGWSPSANSKSCPIIWAQCFDKKKPLYKGIAGLEALGENEGQCIIELPPGIDSGMGHYGAIDLAHEIAPDAKFIVASIRDNHEDSMSRVADWLIEKQPEFNIVAARTTNIVLLETALLKPALRDLCGADEWCDSVSYTPYQDVCSGNPYESGSGFAYKSMTRPPQVYKPIAYQYERMRNAGIIAVKGAGHEGWKAALPYPDCSPALLSVGVVYTGTMPKVGERNGVRENGWVWQGWPWHPDWYCEENSVQPDQVSCATNNAPGLGYELSSGEIASPLMAPHPKESDGGNLGNAFVTPFVVGAIAVLKSSNLAPNARATEIMDFIHTSGATVWDRRKCDQDPQTPEPDGWMRIGADFFDIKLAALEKDNTGDLSKREEQLLQYPWIYNCTDSTSQDTAPYHMDNIPDYSNQRLNIGNAVRNAITIRDATQ